MKTVRSIVRNKLKEYPNLESIIMRGYRRHLFKNERKLIQDELTLESSSPSVIHFSVNKSATQYVKSILKKITESKKLIHINFSDYAFHSDFPYLDQLLLEEFEKYQYLFKQKGILYSSFGRNLKFLKEPEQYKIIVVVRDPRDILVSGFFSNAYSHDVPDLVSSKRDEFLDLRNKALALGIDNYVLDVAGDLLKRFQGYIDLIEKQNSCLLLLKYEDMIDNFEKWLGSIEQYLSISLNEEDREILIQQQKKSQPKEEDKLQHIRKGVAGDYRNKLASPTIAELNKVFKEVLIFFNYSQ